MSLVPTSRFDRAAAFVVVLGAVAVVLAALPFKAFDLDRFFIPKELVLHLTAAISALLVLERLPRASFGVVDVMLGGYLLLGLASSLFADNWWLAARGFAITLSGVTLFWVARTLARQGLARPLVVGLCVAVVLGSATALAQAYMGAITEYASLARAPGGTFGNRNFMAHLSAIGTPALVYVTLTARRRWGVALSALGLGIVAAAVVLSRSRAAWLSLAVAGGLLLLGAIWRRGLLAPAVGRRALLLVAMVAGAVAAALFVPNRLEWKSDSPYLESVTGVVNYRSGSGRGRLIQYRNTFKMAMRAPLLGVGPGNWAVRYPRVASPEDPSLNDEGMTANPWPSSDWAAFLSERGIPATLLLAAAMVGMLAIAAFRLRDARRPEEALEALALAGTVAATLGTGAFDAVLLLAAPSLVAWTLLGALGATVSPLARWSPVIEPPRRRIAMVAVGAIGLLLAVRSGSQITGMAIYDASGSWRSLERATRADPGSYRLRIRAAESALARGDCRRARAQATAARELFPSAPAPKRVLRRCGRR